MSGKAEAEKLAAKKKKEAEKAEAKKLAAEKKAEEAKAAKEKKEAKQAGFLKEISDAINDAETLADLEALNPRVSDIWGENVPVEIQELAFKKGEEIVADASPAKKAVSKKRLQEDWIPMTETDVKKYEKEGILAGYDPKTKTGKLSE